jgi:hypothetical protein
MTKASRISRYGLGSTDGEDQRLIRQAGWLISFWFCVRSLAWSDRVESCRCENLAGSILLINYLSGKTSRLPAGLTSFFG